MKLKKGEMSIRSLSNMPHPNVSTGKKSAIKIEEIGRHLLVPPPQ